jgi:hypothetical protein
MRLWLGAGLSLCMALPAAGVLGRLGQERFELPGIPPGEYRFELDRLPDGWTLLRAAVDGYDLRDGALPVQ